MNLVILLLVARTTSTRTRSGASPTRTAPMRRSSRCSSATRTSSVQLGIPIEMASRTSSSRTSRATGSSADAFELPDDRPRGGRGGGARAGCAGLAACGPGRRDLRRHREAEGGRHRGRPERAGPRRAPAERGGAGVRHVLGGRAAPDARASSTTAQRFGRGHAPATSSRGGWPGLGALVRRWAWTPTAAPADCSGSRGSGATSPDRRSRAPTACRPTSTSTR